ncbi:MAG: maleylpyruvate isomerase family mycothiol-dependent enzyme [Actinomycetota bacterium]
MKWEPGLAADVVRDEGHRLIDLCEASPNQTVAACPGWSATELAVHTASVHRRVAHWCATRADRPDRWPDDTPADAEAPWGWCRDAVELVAGALEGIEPDEPVWSWTDRQNGGFYHRRMVHETVLHRWDAQSLHGPPPPLDAAISADGIDELMSVGMRFRGDGSAIDYPSGSISFLTLDTGDRWSLAAVDGVLGIGRGDAVITGTDATVTGDASAVLLSLWGRDGGELDVRGDASTAMAWREVAP